MNGWTSLSPEESELFMLTVETSIQITKRFQLFLWTQGTLQRFVPHETLICAFGDIERQRCRHEVFSRAVLPSGEEARLCEPMFGLGPLLLRCWRESGSEALVIYGADGSEVGDRLARHGFKSAVCAGLIDSGGESDSFFAFLDHESYSPRHLQFSRMLLPNLHCAYARTRKGEEGIEPCVESAENLLSLRECEVLEWMREGKTNYEIGHILDISPLTVKNHVRNILRKLRVSNRAQAVAAGWRTGLFTRESAAALRVRQATD